MNSSAPRTRRERQHSLGKRFPGKFAPLIMLLMLTACAPYAATRADRLPARQLLVVVTDSWESSQGRLYRFERDRAGWKRLPGSFDVVVGEKGLGWGVGVGGKEATFPEKKEGDRRAPAGIFSLVKAMGYATTAPEGSTFPYEAILASTHCVDDPGSPLYNSIVKESDFAMPVSRLWKSSERMKRADDLYRLLVVMDYNMREPQPEAGSCIFMHIWHSPTTGTAGCTAMAEKDLAETLRWLKSEENPVIVQLPRQVYDRYWKEWQLPAPELLREN